MAEIAFHGAAGTVTGSRTLLKAGGRQVLVDCGLFQGSRELRDRNWARPGFDPAGLDAVLLTHAHIDHSGYLPRLVREGYRGPIHCTPATADLLELLLEDSARIQEEDAEYANKKGYSKHQPALPLYTEDDAKQVIRQLEVGDFLDWHELEGGLRFRWKHAGHIIGSGMIEAELPKAGGVVRCLLSGDIGRYDAPLVGDPSEPDPCDVLVIESTYGDRGHPHGSVRDQLRVELLALIESGGTMLVPSFAVGRAQQLVYLLHEIMQAEGLSVPIHLDSPMAVDTTKIYRRYPEEHGLEDMQLRTAGNVLYGEGVFLHKTREDSMRLNDLQGPRVIISSSGMLTGGRVLHHLRRLAPEAKNRIVLAGYQAHGTRGRRLQDGEPFVRVHGMDVPVRATVASVSGMSAHADSDQLIRWVHSLQPPRVTYVTHGEPHSARALAERLEQELGHHCVIPRHEERFEL
ncbi:MAG: MBL fold metallo-hydrolase [Planctomycetota bacterium]